MRFLALTTLVALAAASAQAYRADWVRQERTSKTNIVSFSVAMPQQNLDKLDTIFHAVTDPSSPQYGQYKEPVELGRLTATDPEIAKEVFMFFEQHGARCKSYFSHLECRAAVQEVEEMFACEMFEWEHKTLGAKASRVGGAYKFPDELQGKVEFVSGLTMLPVARYGRTYQGVTDYSVVPETLYTLYNIKSSGSSKVSQSAAEFQNYPAYSEQDLKTFISNTGISSFSISNKVGPFNPTFPGAESTLDVQYLGAVGRGNNNWYWTESQWMFDFTNSLLKLSRSSIPDVISMSYGWSEAQQCEIAPSSRPCEEGSNVEFVQRVNSNFQQIGATGVTVLASSGDAGAHGRSDDGCQASTLNPAYPAACPWLTAVGATMFDSNSVQTGGSEPVCKNQLQCAVGGTEVVCTTRNFAALITSGGGFSNVAGRPSYQDAVVSAYLNKGSPAVPPSSDFNSSGRGYPDVAALGHAYYIQLDGSLQAVDGTSASCPVFAGVIGLLNAYRVENGKPTIGFANPLLYKMAKDHPEAFNDVTSGDNKCTEQTCCQTGYGAAQGWDATTGLGTPNVAKMLSALQQMDNLREPSDAVLKTLRGFMGSS